MAVVKRWVAVGASAAMLAGGLVLNGPAAVAATNDPACVQASSQFHPALGAAGITVASIVELEEASAAATAAHAHSEALREAAAGELWAQMDVVSRADDAARPALLAAEEALRVAQASGDEEAIAAAEEQLAAAQAQLAPIEAQADELMAALAVALGTPEVVAAQHALDAAYHELETLRASLGLDEASASRLLGLAGQARAACGDLTVGSPVTAPVSPAPVAVNPGLNVDTAVPSAAGRAPGPGLLAGSTGLVVAALGGAATWKRRSRRGRA